MRSAAQLLTVLAVLALPGISCALECPEPCQRGRNTLTCNIQITSFSVFEPGKDCQGIDTILLSDNSITNLNNGDLLAFPDVEMIDLQYNKLTKVEESVFSDVPKLDELILIGNTVTNLTSLNIPNLVQLNLRGNSPDLSSSYPGPVAPKLQTLILAECKLSIFKKEVLRSASNLKSLDLSKNRLTVLDSNWFEYATGVTTLNISHNEVESLLFSSNYLGELQELDLSHNAHLGELDPYIFQQMPKLKTLFLEHTTLLVSANGPVLYHGAINNLSLASCDARELSATAFSYLPALQWLDLSNNKLFDVEGVLGSSDLRVVILNGNGLSTVTGDIFNATPALEELHLNSNLALSTFNVSAIEPLGNLRLLDVSDTPLACFCLEDYWLLMLWANETGAQFLDSCGRQPSCEWEITTIDPSEEECLDIEGFCSADLQCCPNGTCAETCTASALSTLSLTLLLLLGMIVAQ